MIVGRQVQHVIVWSILDLRTRQWRSRRPWFVAVIVSAGLWWSIVQLVGSLAPHAYSRPVPAARVASFDSSCGVFGPAVSAVATDSVSGMTSYTVTCSLPQGSAPVIAYVTR